MKSLLLSLLFMPAVAFARQPSEDDTPLPPRTPGPQSVVLHSETLISAPPAAVWEAMTDLAAYTQWNPWIVRAEGEVAMGGLVRVDVRLGATTMQAKHVVNLVEPYARLCWRDAGWNADFVYGQRCRSLAVQEDGQVLYQVDLLLDGVLSGVAGLFQGKDLRDGMAAETAALKARAEAL